MTKTDRFNVPLFQCKSPINQQTFLVFITFVMKVQIPVLNLLIIVNNQELLVLFSFNL